MTTLSYEDIGMGEVRYPGSYRVSEDELTAFAVRSTTDSHRRGDGARVGHQPDEFINWEGVIAGSEIIAGTTESYLTVF